MHIMSCSWFNWDLCVCIHKKNIQLLSGTCSLQQGFAQAERKNKSEKTTIPEDDSGFYRFQQATLRSPLGARGKGGGGQERQYFRIWLYIQ